MLNVWALVSMGYYYIFFSQLHFYYYIKSARVGGGIIYHNVCVWPHIQYDMKWKMIRPTKPRASQIYSTSQFCESLLISYRNFYKKWKRIVITIKKMYLTWENIKSLKIFHLVLAFIMLEQTYFLHCRVSEHKFVMKFRAMSYFYFINSPLSNL